MDDSRLKSAREVLSAFFDEEQLRRGGRYAEFFASWRYLAGEQLAAHSHIADIENGVLYVEAEHPGWIQLLQLRQSAILDGIAARFPEFGLRAIAFRLGSARPAPSSQKKSREENPSMEPETSSAEAEKTPLAPSAEGRAAAEGAGAARRPEDLADPALRDLFTRLKSAMEKRGDESRGKG